MVKRCESRRLQIVQLVGPGRVCLGQERLETLLFLYPFQKSLSMVLPVLSTMSDRVSTCRYRRHLLNLMISEAVIEKVAANEINLGMR